MFYILTLKPASMFGRMDPKFPFFGMIQRNIFPKTRSMQSVIIAERRVIFRKIAEARNELVLRQKIETKTRKIETEVIPDKVVEEASLTEQIVILQNATTLDPAGARAVTAEIVVIVVTVVIVENPTETEVLTRVETRILNLARRIEIVEDEILEIETTIGETVILLDRDRMPNLRIL